MMQGYDAGVRQFTGDFNQLFDEYNQLQINYTNYARSLRRFAGCLCADYNQLLDKHRLHIHAHRVTEDELIAALKLENANHPLASREAVDAAVEDKRVAALVDPEVIKRTYPDGVLPEGAVIPPNLVGPDLVGKVD